jgi:hypothetical protein
VSEDSLPDGSPAPLPPIEFSAKLTGALKDPLWDAGAPGLLFGSSWFVASRRRRRVHRGDIHTKTNSNFQKISANFFSNTPIDLYGREAPPSKTRPPGRRVSRISMLFPGSEEAGKAGGWCEMFQCIVHTKPQRLTLILESA